MPADQKTKAPANLSFEDAEKLRAKKAIKTRERAAGQGNPWGNS